VARLETSFLGITFPNPFLLAAGPPTANGAMIIKAFDAGWGGAVTKTIALEPTEHPSPRVFVVQSGRNKRGMVDIELFSDLTLERWEEEIDSIRASYPQRPIIASMAGGGNPREWQEVIRRLAPHGVNGYEMNVSCPNFSKAKMGGKLGQDPEALESAVRWVREATDLPVIVKLTPNVTDIVALARVAVEAGADAVTATNSLIGLGGIDLDTFAPLPTVDGIGIFGGYGGPGLKPVSLRCAASIAQALPIPIIGWRYCQLARCRRVLGGWCICGRCLYSCDVERSSDHRTDGRGSQWLPSEQGIWDAGRHHWKGPVAYQNVP